MSPDSEESVSTPELDAMISHARKRAATVSSGMPVPQKLNSRASVIIPSNGRSPSSSPRTRTLSTSRTPCKQSESDITLDSSTENELRGCLQDLVSKQNEEIQRMEEKAEKKRKFITDTLKSRVMNPKRSVHGLFDQSDDESEPFCVTIPSTPCDTPPPERVLSERSTQTQITKIYDIQAKMMTRITAIETNLARINNEQLAASLRHLEQAQERPSSCSVCMIF